MHIFIALGSNIDAEANFRRAAAMLKDQFPNIRFSSVYRTAPQEVEDQADFLNAAAAFENDAPAEKIHNCLQSIEKTLNKNPPYRYGPRTIDLDILLYGDERINLPGLIIPHPKMHERRFVLEPLAELLDSAAIQTSLETLHDQKCLKTPIKL